MVRRLAEIEIQTRRMIFVVPLGEEEEEVYGWKSVDCVSLLLSGEKKSMNACLPVCVRWVVDVWMASFLERNVFSD